MVAMIRRLWTRPRLASGQLSRLVCASLSVVVAVTVLLTADPVLGLLAGLATAATVGGLATGRSSWISLGGVTLLAALLLARTATWLLIPAVGATLVAIHAGHYGLALRAAFDPETPTGRGEVVHLGGLGAVLAGGLALWVGAFHFGAPRVPDHVALVLFAGALLAGLAVLRERRTVDEK